MQQLFGRDLRPVLSTADATGNGDAVVAGHGLCRQFALAAVADKTDGRGAQSEMGALSVDGLAAGGADIAEGSGWFGHIGFLSPRGAAEGDFLIKIEGRFSIIRYLTGNCQINFRGPRL